MGLQQKWKVNTTQFILILCTFAVGGSVCGYAARKILQLAQMPKGFLYYLLYILFITILWPIAVLLVSIVFGQFSFFKNYISKIKKRLFK